MFRVWGWKAIRTVAVYSLLGFGIVELDTAIKQRPSKASVEVRMFSGKEQLHTMVS